MTRERYKFDELPDDIKEKAIENLANINLDDEWWGFIKAHLHDKNWR